MTTPAEVAAALEQLASDARQQALGHLTLAGVSLTAAVELLRFEPDSETAIDNALNVHVQRLGAGHEALEQLKKYRRAHANMRGLEGSPAAGPASAADGAPVTVSPLAAPTDRGAKLDDLATAMVKTAASASTNLQALVDILRAGGEGAAEAICEQMQSFTARAQEFQTIFATAGEVAGCAASA